MDHCGCVFAGGLTNILSRALAYKTKEGCRDGLLDEETFPRIMKDKHLDLLFTEKELEAAKIKYQTKGKDGKTDQQRIKKPKKINLIETDTDWFEFICPGVDEATKYQQRLISKVLHSIGTQHVELYVECCYYDRYDKDLKKRSKMADFLYNCDYIQHLPGAKVAGHIDAEGFPKKTKAPIFGPYCASKIGQKGKEQMLCHHSLKGSSCGWSLWNEENVGHSIISPGSLYFMFNEGAFGGPTHALHNTVCSANREDKQTWGGFLDYVYTLVFRPFFNKK